MKCFATTLALASLCNAIKLRSKSQYIFESWPGYSVDEISKEASDVAKKIMQACDKDNDGICSDLEMYAYRTEVWNLAESTRNFDIAMELGDLVYRLQDEKEFHGDSSYNFIQEDFEQLV